MQRLIVRTYGHSSVSASPECLAKVFEVYSHRMALRQIYCKSQAAPDMVKVLPEPVCP